MAAGKGMWDKWMTKGGNRLGAAVGAGAGLSQIIKGKKDQQRADAVMPSDVDSNQGAFLAELNQKRNAMNTGAQYTSSIDAVNDNLGNTESVISENSGGDASGMISSLLKSQAVANQGVGQVEAQGEQAEGTYTGMYGDLLNKMTQRKMELGLLKRAQAQSDATTEKKAGWANFLGGAQSFMNWKGGDQASSGGNVGGSGADSGIGGGNVATTSMPADTGGTGSKVFGNRSGVEGFNLGSNKSLGTAPNLSGGGLASLNKGNVTGSKVMDWTSLLKFGK